MALVVVGIFMGAGAVGGESLSTTACEHNTGCVLDLVLTWMKLKLGWKDGKRKFEESVQGALREQEKEI